MGVVREYSLPVPRVKSVILDNIYIVIQNKKAFATNTSYTEGTDEFN
jgi:hypothetical protein